MAKTKPQIVTARESDTGGARIHTERPTDI